MNMNNVEKEVSQSICTGCGCCENICPTDAVTMAENNEGFLVPAVESSKCINCGKCISSCPALNVKHDNNPTPKVFEVRASKETRNISSSGGMFTVLADHILLDSGVVYGAAFDSNMQLNHISVNEKGKLDALKGSKYIQSNTGKIYRDIKEKLIDGKKVLFVGTPCQVAALNSFLGNKYDNLFTVDLICHGVPSQYEFNKYIKELGQRLHIPENCKVKKVNFRDKRFGWTSEHIVVEYDNGTIYHADLARDSYVKMFFKNLGLRRSCSNCPFSEYPRQGDISIGDFWGISKINPQFNDGMGTSLVLLNTNKGEALFKESLNNEVTRHEIDFDPKKIGNRTSAYYSANKNRERFFTLNKHKSFHASVDLVLNDFYDVGIVSNWYAANFGGSLTQYALYHTVEDMGYSALMIERPAEALDKTSIKDVKKIYKEFPYPSYAYAKQYATKEQMSELNKYCGRFLVGSDQLFQYTLYCRLGKFVTLDWVQDTKIKAAYAASYGHDRIWGQKDELASMAYFIKKFDYFSVREESGIEITKNTFGITPELVLDPVFLCNTKHYDELISKSDRVVEKGYISAYILDPDRNKYDIIKNVKENLHLPEEIFSELEHSQNYVAPLEDLNIVHLKIEERLQSIKNCSFFVTDSFHGMCFAIIFKKPFIAILNEKRGGSRFRSLLKAIHLENRLVTNPLDIQNRPNLLSDIEYNRVYETLDKERIRCITWLKKALSDNKSKPLSDYDMLQQLVKSQQSRILHLQSENENLTQKLGIICGMLNLGFLCETNFRKYLIDLNKIKHKYLILIAVKDTPGVVFKEDFAALLNKLGLKISLYNQHWHSYLAVIDKGKVQYENLGEVTETLCYATELKGISIKLTSSGYKAENKAEIVIDNVDYSKNLRGLNFVLLDKKTMQVIDSVVFDTNVSLALCTR